MITDEQRSKIAELKALIAATAAAPGGAPEEVREAVLVLKKALHRAGTTARELATALGVHESTLCRWEREARDDGEPRTRRRRSSRRVAPREPASSSFRPVQVVASATTKAPAALASMTAQGARGLRVAHAPSGLVVDGLDVETLAALLRRLS
jgi:transposase-like protein